jgi:hypothetical protein
MCSCRSFLLDEWDELPQRLALMKPKQRLQVQWPKGAFTLAQLVKLNPSVCEITLRVIISKNLEAGTLRQMTPIASKRRRTKSVFSFTGAQRHPFRDERQYR